MKTTTLPPQFLRLKRYELEKTSTFITFRRSRQGDVQDRVARTSTAANENSSFRLVQLDVSKHFVLPSAFLRIGSQLFSLTA